MASLFTFLSRHLLRDVLCDELHPHYRSIVESPSSPSLSRERWRLERGPCI